MTCISNLRADNESPTSPTSSSVMRAARHRVLRYQDVDVIGEEETMRMICVVAVCGLLVGCNRAQANNDNTGTGNTATPTTPSTMNTPPTANTGTTGAQGMSGKLDSSDRLFVEKAASGGMAEVQLGRLAMDRGTSKNVRDFGKRMVDDHSKANDELKTLASKKQIALPEQMTSEQKDTYDRLSKLSGKDFDKQYMQVMVKDHDEDVSEFKKEADKGQDPDLRSFAQKTLPVLQEHDQIAHTNEKMGSKRK